MPRAKNLGLIIVGIVIGLSGVAVYRSVHNNNDKSGKSNNVGTRAFNDNQLGVSFSLPVAYEQKADTPQPSSAQKGALPAKNFEKLNPQGLLTLRYESGLATPASLTHRTILELIEGDTREFFPVKYKNYKGDPINRMAVAGREALDHTYTYTLQDGSKLKARLVAIPFDNDSAYYILLQAPVAVFDQINPDMDVITRSLQLNGPSKT